MIFPDLLDAVPAEFARLGMCMRRTQTQMLEVIHEWQTVYVPDALAVGRVPRLLLNLGQSQGHTQLHVVLATLYANLLIAVYNTEHRRRVLHRCAEQDLDIDHRQVCTYANINDGLQQPLKDRVLVIDGYRQMPHAQLVAAAQARGVVAVIQS